MRAHNVPVLPAATLLACITSVLAQSLPYNPTYLLKGQNSKVYQFSPNSSPQFSVYDVTNSLSKDGAAEALTSVLPFLANGSNAFVPIATNDSITVFSGECSEGEQELDLWTYGYGANNNTWTRMQTTSTESDLSANFLAAGFTFPNSQIDGEDSFYIFGGMCPNGTSNQSSWTTDATYSNTLLALSPEDAEDYQVSLTGTRSPPVAEAGLTITPLVPTTFGADNTSQQQNFVLIGGHTHSAFINMSQVALFSMPEQAWAFIGINQPTDTVVEPRSGHTAVITEDGSQIVVFGGWVGNITYPATPQLVVLDIGQGYGGNGSWSWIVPKVDGQYTDGDDGVYGHGAAMLPGDVMMVTGGYPITSITGKKAKRASTNTMFYNTTAASWSDSYTNPVTLANTQDLHSGLSSGGKTGLGTGLGIGIIAVLMVAAVWYWYARRKRQQRIIREKRLRELALGTNDGSSTAEFPRRGSQMNFTGNRSASWGARQEEAIETDRHQSGSLHFNSEMTGHSDALDISGPDRGLTNSLRSRSPFGMASHGYPGMSAPGAVFTIEEVEERSERESLTRPRSAGHRPISDPFKDPPTPPPVDEAAQQRKQEVQHWVEDWQSVAESMSVQRSPSKANSRTYSNLSAYHPGSSGEKSSDRTNSDLSERSNVSNLSRANTGIVSRNLSQRSGNAGYALFSTAAMAVGKLAGRPDHHAGVERSASKRAVSTGDLAKMAAGKRKTSLEQLGQRPKLATPQSREELKAAADYFTPNGSSIKDYKKHNRNRSNSSTSHSNSLTNQSKKALGALGQATKRVLTGTSNVNVTGRVDSIEGREYSPTKLDGPEMAEIMPRRVSSSGATFWRQRQGARDWDDSPVERSDTVRRRPGRSAIEDGLQDNPPRNEDDWDVEMAVQQRVVQVMFTVPKEKLRVVNADNLSLMSRSDTNASRDSNKSEEGRDVQRTRRLAGAVEQDRTITDSAMSTMSNSLHPSSAVDFQEKDKMVERQKSGDTIGKAL